MDSLSCTKSQTWLHNCTAAPCSAVCFMLKFSSKQQHLFLIRPEQWVRTNTVGSRCQCSPATPPVSLSLHIQQCDRSSWIPLTRLSLKMYPLAFYTRAHVTHTPIPFCRDVWNDLGSNDWLFRDQFWFIRHTRVGKMTAGEHKNNTMYGMTTVLISRDRARGFPSPLTPWKCEDRGWALPWLLTFSSQSHSVFQRCCMPERLC